RLERGKELAEVTLHSIVDGVITTDAAGLIEYMNPVAEKYLGWTTAQARGMQLSAVYRVIDERSGQPIETLPGTEAPALPEEAMAVRLRRRQRREAPAGHSARP